MMALVLYVFLASVFLRPSLCYLTEKEILQRLETNMTSPSVYNTRLTQHLIARYQVDHRLQCSQLCYLTRDCQSYNYYEDEGVCELNDLIYIQGLVRFSFTTGQDPGWDYYDRHSFYMIRAWWYECPGYNPCQNGGVCTRKVLGGSGGERPPCAPLCVCPVGYSGPHCSIQDCQVGRGASFRGKVPVTNTGRICQRWDSQMPHGHGKTPSGYSSSGLERNYCRNPDGGNGVWCYTMDPDRRWELCDVPQC
ncbi:PREDICTED: hepatocyte growth factor-like [Branchiostoma belcheri]|uniref:Hepatocyte growth factor-like n=1 Tax=Branchiostoma belcheri TaxID=7741 RepID=A0A6P4YCN5_BRABE|nr:PREDICTED: hepatocyte growth factor-like [Branchiostoma belcheri]